MKYGYKIIYIESVNETIEFYEKAFGFQQKFVTPENDYENWFQGKRQLPLLQLN